MYYLVKEYNILEKLELFQFESFIKENSSIYDIDEYRESSDEDSEVDDY